MTDSLRADAIRIFQAALEAADPRHGIRSKLRLEGSVLFAGEQEYRLDEIRSIYVVGAGKASANMAVALEEILCDRITGGLINTKHGHLAPLRYIELNECGHPVPDDAGVRGALRIAGIASEAARDDLVICLISGGASALTPLPAQGLSLTDKQTTTSLLLASGANIHEINTVRKHISRIKGGQLAALAFPAKVLSLILSDVIGDDLDVIGSGLTAPDRSTFADAHRILDRYRIRDKVPAPILEHLTAAREETPKPDSPVFARTQNLIVGSNNLALEAAEREAEQLGYNTLILSSSIQGETRDVAGVHAAIAREIPSTKHPVSAPACVLSGGETTVTLHGDGKGGRNQEFALSAAVDIAGLPETVIFSAGTDGTDGPTDAAGGICDGTTVNKAAIRGLNAAEYLARNDSYHFLEAIGGLIRTGPTGTNVMDVRIILSGRTGPQS